ncbi:MAG: hypothetical protein RL380_1698 [Verrucomicrobiota bacterium]|jgi:uncharacterized membrane protein
MTALHQKSRRWKRWLKVFIWLTVIYAIVGFLVLPRFVREKAIEEIAKRLDREVAIREVRLNPFALSTTIRGLVIRDKDGEAFVAWDEVYVNFEIASLFSKAWIFREVSTTKPYACAGQGEPRRKLRRPGGRVTCRSCRSCG